MSKQNTARQAFEDLFVVVPPTPQAPQNPEPPVIVAQPDDCSLELCKTAIFSARAQGTAPLKFQWRKNGRDIPRSTGESGGDGIIEVCSQYSNIPVDLEEDGSQYDCVVSNSAGSITTSPATLTVLVPRAKTEYEQTIAIIEAPAYLVQQARSIERRRLAGTFDEDAYEEKNRPCFQRYAFDNSLRGAPPDNLTKKTRLVAGTGSKGCSAEGGACDISEIFAGKTARQAGLHVVLDRTDKTYQGPRTDMPFWILDQNLFHDFLDRLVARGVKRKDWAGKTAMTRQDVIRVVRLDYLILYRFYALRHEDAQIFEDLREALGNESGRQRRGTSSAAAVKKRRRRLVELGNGIYGKRPPKRARHRPNLAEEK